MPEPQDPAPEGTRLALIEAGLDLFGRKGFAATSTRELAARAATNVASIAYHFGGKEGLRSACAAEFARRIAAVLAAVPDDPPATPEAARARLHQILRAVATFVVATPQARDAVAFMLRELADGGGTVDAVYRRLVDPVHRRLCGLWAGATGQDAESPAVRLTVFSLVGQVLYFRIGQPIVTRRMDWERIGADEAAAIARVLAANLDAMLDASRKGLP